MVNLKLIFPKARRWIHVKALIRLILVNIFCFLIEKCQFQCHEELKVFQT